MNFRVDYYLIFNILLDPLKKGFEIKVLYNITIEKQSFKRGET